MSVGAATGGSGGHGQGTPTATPQSVGLQAQTPSNVTHATNDGKKLRYSVNIGCHSKTVLDICLGTYSLVYDTCDSLRWRVHCEPNVLHMPVLCTQTAQSLICKHSMHICSTV